MNFTTTYNRMHEILRNHESVTSVEDQIRAYEQEQDNIELGSDWTVTKSPTAVSPSAFAEWGIKVYYDTEYREFRFTGRRYLHEIYDMDLRLILWKCARQTEKTVGVNARILLENGLYKRAGQIVIGDSVAAFCSDKQTTHIGKVVWVSERYKKRGYRIRTRQGHTLELGHEHPVRTWEAWTKAEDLVVGQKIAVVRRAGVFSTGSHRSAEEAEFIGMMLGDGSFRQKSLTGLPGPVIERFKEICSTWGWRLRTYSKANSRAVSIRTTHNTEEYKRLCGALLNTRSDTRFIPDWVFDLDREKTALFINRIWSTDGHCKVRSGGTKYEFSYASNSERLVKQLQALLWKFGIPTKVSKYVPTYWKRKGIHKWAYKLYIETLSGIQSFVNEIGALGKTEDISFPQGHQVRSNRYGFPKEIYDLIKAINKTRSSSGRGDTLRAHRISYTSCAPTREKLQQFYDFFVERDFNQEEVKKLEHHINGHVDWDVIVSIEVVEELECVDFQVDPGSSFIAEGVVTHNSTFLGNRGITSGCLYNGFRTIYVSPSNEQTKTFSRDKLDDIIYQSEELHPFIGNLADQSLYLKRWEGTSSVYMLYYAYHNANRLRGKFGDELQVDEYQSIKPDLMPVIEACLHHSTVRRQIRAGTPLTLDNHIEKSWQDSTQCEWVVPCTRCGGERAGNPNAGHILVEPHWQILTEDNISKRGLVCHRCNNLINPFVELSHWEQLNPRGGPWWGFHITQLQTPWIVGDKDAWYDLVHDFETMPITQFRNERLGISDDSATRPITMERLKECSDGGAKRVDLPAYREWSRSNPVWMGIDWSPGESENSYDVITMATLKDGKFDVFFMQRCEGRLRDPKHLIPYIVRLAHEFNVKAIGSDYGMGQDRNKELVGRLGRQKIKIYQYHEPNYIIKYSRELGRFICHKPEIFDALFMAARDGYFRFPDWNEFYQPCGQDVLNIFAEHVEGSRHTHRYSHNGPDDSWSALVFCYLASYITGNPSPNVLFPGGMPNYQPEHMGLI